MPPTACRLTSRSCTRSRTRPSSTTRCSRSSTTIAARHPVLRLTLGERRRFPDTLYASVDPDPPLRALHDELAAAFPTLPLYGGAFDFVPHVSIVEGPAASEPGALDEPAWQALPFEQLVDAIDLITGRDGAWATRRRFPLGTAA